MKVYFRKSFLVLFLCCMFVVIHGDSHDVWANEVSAGVEADTMMESDDESEVTLEDKGGADNETELNTE